MVHIIGIGEFAVSKNPEDSIKTYALASCVGLVVYNIRDQILGMVHIVLPNARDKDDQVAKGRSGYYADMAVPFILSKVFRELPSDRKDYRITLYGGAASKGKEDYFCVGERNVAEVEQLLAARGMAYNKQNTGGYCSRTIEAFVKDGRVTVKMQDMKF